MTNNRWIIGGGRALGPAPFLLMGILNLSPESFSDAARGVIDAAFGGEKAQGDDPFKVSRTSHISSHPESRLADLGKGNVLSGFKARARSMAQDGADVLDLGGESTRPGAPALSIAEECRRLLPALEAVREEFSESAPDDRPAISVDTYKAETARTALESGAEIINDISAWSFEPKLKEVILEHRPGYVLMHCQGRPADMQADPRYGDVVEEVYAFLERKLEELVRAGFPEEHVVIDPGIGFGKTLKHNLALLRNIGRFHALGRPVLIGISYKSFLGRLTGAPLAQRGGLTMAASALLAGRGAWAHRVHDVAAVRQALQLARNLAGE